MPIVRHNTTSHATPVANIKTKTAERSCQRPVPLASDVLNVPQPYSDPRADAVQITIETNTIVKPTVSANSILLGSNRTSEVSPVISPNVNTDQYTT
jgi:hypothetical protein